MRLVRMLELMCVGLLSIGLGLGCGSKEKPAKDITGPADEPAVTAPGDTAKKPADTAKKPADTAKKPAAKAKKPADE